MENQKQYYNLLIAKKTEKIVTAIYLITQFLKDTENIKIEIRSEANKLLRNINLFAYGEHRDIFTLYKECLDSVSLLLTYLTLAKNTNLISKMNSDIVIDALRTIENVLIKKQFNITKENLLIVEEDLFLQMSREGRDTNVNRNTSFDALTERSLKLNVDNFDTSHTTNTHHENKKVDTEKAVKILKDKILYKGQNQNDISKNTINTVSKNIIPKIESKPIIKKVSAVATNKTKQNQDRKDSRRDQILGLFTKGVEVSINDISKKIVGCSVKTIQRELNDLVVENKIKKIGEKRWSRYVLA